MPEARSNLAAQIPEFMQGHNLAQIASGSGDPHDDDYQVPHEPVVDIAEADIINSVDGKTGLHRPVLDIDMPVHVIPSTTPGHGHLYIDKPMTWDQYEALLYALDSAGIIETGYVAASLERGYTSVRLPWVKKYVEEKK